MTVRFRPALWPTLFTIPAILMLLALGTWQVQRLQWKQGVIDRIDERLHGAPTPLPAGALDADAWEYRPVSVTGELLSDREIHLIASNAAGRAGWHVIAPLRRADGGGYVLVNRGWVPQDRKDPATRPEAPGAGVQTITGVVRKPWRQGWFVPDNEPARNIWFFGDAAAMWGQLGLQGPLLFVEAAAGAPNVLPAGGQTRVRIPNDHLQYAVTWYGFAIVLLVIYWAWHRRQGRA